MFYVFWKSKEIQLEFWYRNYNVVVFLTITISTNMILIIIIYIQKLYSMSLYIKKSSHFTMTIFFISENILFCCKMACNVEFKLTQKAKPKLFHSERSFSFISRLQPSTLIIQRRLIVSTSYSHITFVDCKSSIKSANPKIIIINFGLCSSCRDRSEFIPSLSVSCRSWVIMDGCRDQRLKNIHRACIKTSGGFPLDKIVF